MPVVVLTLFRELPRGQITLDGLIRPLLAISVATMGEECKRAAGDVKRVGKFVVGSP
jgi:hypothetical protein